MTSLELASPSALWLLLLAAPIVALHLYRGRLRTIEVPCLALWERLLATQARTSGFRSLRNLLLLLFNLAALAGLVGALGDPRPRTPAVTPHDWALLLDTSLSMRARDCESGDRWSAAVAAVRTFLAALPASDRVLLVSCGTSVRAAGPHPPDSEPLATFVAGLAPGGVEAPLERALALARALLPAAEHPQFIFFSDGAAVSGLAEFVRAPDHGFVCLGSRTDHLALLDVDVDRLWGSPRALAFARARNFGRYPREALLTVRAGERVVSSRKLSFGPGQELTTTLEIPAEVGDRAVVELGDPDFFDEDRRAYLALPPFRRPRVLVVAEREPDPFLVPILGALRNALDADGSGVTRPDGLAQALAAVGPDDVVVYDGVSPSRPLPPGNYLFLGSAGEYLPVRPSTAVEKPVVWRWSVEPGLFRPIAVDSLRIGRSLVAAPGAGERALIECPQGALAVFGQRDKVSYAWLGFRLSDSNFPLLVAFPLFVKGLFAWFAGERDWVFEECYSLGAPIRPRVALPEDASSVTIIDESDPRRRWQVPVIRRGFEFWGADRPGFYRVEAGGLAWRTGVNFASAAESDLAPRKDLAHPPPPLPRAPVTAAEPWRLYLACAAVAALLAEWLLFHRTRE